MGEKIRVIAAPDPTLAGKGMGGRIEAVTVELDADVLRTGLQHVRGVVESLLIEPEPKSKGLTLKEVSVGLEISAEGGVTLIGTLTAGATAAITLSFERS